VILDSAAEAVRLIVTGNSYVWQIVWLSLRVSGIAVLIGTLLGMPVGIALALARFPGRRFAIALVYTGFALPPVFVGLLVYMMLSRAGPLGELGMLFTPPAMILAQSLLAAPYVAGVTLAAVQAVPQDVRYQALALGASRLEALWAHVREARVGLVAAVIAGFGTVVSEVGAVLLVGGNVAGETRVLTTAIVLETRRGNFAFALALGFILLAIAFIVNAALTRVQQTGVGGARAAGWFRS
jgi:tungstate transport system permease protein